MSLRSRLLLTLGLTLALLWGVAAAWLMRDLEEKFVETLDQRLAQSARMVAGLVLQLPFEAWQDAEFPVLSIPPIEGLACQVNSPQGEIMARTHADMDDILAPGEGGHAYRQADDVTWRVFTYERGGVIITTADRMDERNMLLSGVVRMAVVPFVVALVGSMVALWLGIWRGLVPLTRLRESLAQRHPDALAPVATYGLPKEIRPLIDTLNALLARIQQTVIREQRFTNDAAHELRTPLTAIKTHLQVARRQDGQAAMTSLNHAEEGVVRLSSTLDQLLTLARVEGRLRFDDGEASRVADVAEHALADSQQSMSEQSMSEQSMSERFVVPSSWPEATLVMPRELAITALRNLLDNALRHGPADTPIALAAEWQPGASYLTFSVRDQGPGVDEATLAQLTQRFWRASKQQGSGLGLAIVAAIAERFGGNLTFESPVGGGFTACLKVPVANS